MLTRTAWRAIMWLLFWFTFAVTVAWLAWGGG